MKIKVFDIKSCKSAPRAPSSFQQLVVQQLYFIRTITFTIERILTFLTIMGSGGVGSKLGVQYYLITAKSLQYSFDFFTFDKKYNLSAKINCHRPVLRIFSLVYDDIILNFFKNRILQSIWQNARFWRTFLPGLTAFLGILITEIPFLIFWEHFQTVFNIFLISSSTRARR